MSNSVVVVDIPIYRVVLWAGHLLGKLKYYFFCFLFLSIFTWKPVYVNSTFVHLNLLIIALLNPWLINYLLLSILCSWGCIYVNLFNKSKSQVPIAYYFCPLICLCIVLGLLIEFRDSLPNVLELFEEVLPPFCLEQEYIFL